MLSIRTDTNDRSPRGFCLPVKLATIITYKYALYPTELDAAVGLGLSFRLNLMFALHSAKTNKIKANSIIVRC